MFPVSRWFPGRFGIQVRLHTVSGTLGVVSRISQSVSTLGKVFSVRSRSAVLLSVDNDECDLCVLFDSWLDSLSIIDRNNGFLNPIAVKKIFTHFFER